MISVWNPNNNIEARFFFWLECLNSGRVIPNKPQVSVPQITTPLDAWPLFQASITTLSDHGSIDGGSGREISTVSPILVFAFYYLCEGTMMGTK